MSIAIQPKRIALQKSSGFLGARLAALLATNQAFELVSALPDPAAPADVLLLNSWGSVPSSSAGQPLAEITYSLTPLLKFLSDYSTAVPKHVVFFSSAGAVYANQGDAGGVETLSESTELSPNSAYGAGKIAAEAFLRAESARLEFALTILRITNVYGPGQAMRVGFGIIPAIYQTMTSDAVMSLWPSSQQPRDYLYIDDFLDAFLALTSAPAPQAGTQVFNLGSDFSANVPELIAIAETTLRKTCRTSVQLAHSRDPKIALPSAAAFRSAFNWRAQVGLEEGIARTFLDLANRS